MSLLRINWPWTLRGDRNFTKPLPPRRTPWVELAPAIGSYFTHCALGMTVIDIGCVYGYDWRDGVLCHYRDDRGQVRELFFTPAQWQGLKQAARLNLREPKAVKPC